MYPRIGPNGRTQLTAGPRHGTPALACTALRVGHALLRKSSSVAGWTPSDTLLHPTNQLLSAVEFRGISFVSSGGCLFEMACPDVEARALLVHHAAPDATASSASPPARWWPAARCTALARRGLALLLVLGLGYWLGRQSTQAAQSAPRGAAVAQWVDSLNAPPKISPSGGSYTCLICPCTMIASPAPLAARVRSPLIESSHPLTPRAGGRNRQGQALPPRL